MRGGVAIPLASAAAALTLGPRLARRRPSRPSLRARSSPTGVCVSNPRVNGAACDDVVLDATTNLIWQRAVAGDPYNWDDAKDYCQTLGTIPGYPSGWRLPTREELLSIVDGSRQDPSIDPEKFPGTPSDCFWSSSPFDASRAWCVDFSGGVALNVDVAAVSFVRCVR